MRNFFEKNIHFILMLGGIVFLVVAVISFGKQMSYKETKAEIVSIEYDYDHSNDTTNYNVTVKYNVDGKKYESLLGEYDISMSIGKEIKILYNPKDPSKIVKKGFFGVALELVFGIGCEAIGISTFIKKKKEKSIETENGESI